MSVLPFSTRIAHQAGHQSPQGAMRWHPVYYPSANGTVTEAIPPHAIMEVYEDISVKNPFGSRHFMVGKPGGSYNPAGRQSAGLYLINGAHPILPGRSGRGTQDTPVRVLAENTGTGAVGTGVGRSVGPVKDSWKVSNKGTAYTAIGQAETAPGDSDALVWISSPGVSALQVYASGGGSGNISPGQYIPISVASVSDDNFAYINGGLQIKQAGTYLFGARATLSAPTYTAMQVMTLYANHSGNDFSAAGSTGQSGWRQNGSEWKDSYSGTVVVNAKENVAFSGIVAAAEDSTFWLVNGSGVSVDFDSANIWMARMY